MVAAQLTLPMAVGAALAGFLNLPFGHLDFLTQWLEPVVGEHEAVLTELTSATRVAASVHLLLDTRGGARFAERPRR